MTKEITKSIILQEIQDKLKLRELEPERFRFSELVVPTYNIEQHLRRREVVYKEVSITAAGGYEFLTVPMTERWTVGAYNIIFLTGSYKVSGMYVLRKLSDTFTDNVYYDLKLNQSVSYIVVLSQPLILDPGDEMRILVDDYTSTGNLRLYVDVMKEEIR